MADRQVNIFNFSFLDILACTLGALIFILVIIVMVNTYTSEQGAALQEIQEMEKDLAAARKDIDMSAKKQSRIKSEIQSLGSAIEQKKRNAKLASENEERKKQIEELRKVIRRKNEKKIQIWPPRAMKTEKMPTIPLVFQDGRLAPLQDPYYKIVKDNLNRTIAKKLRQGETGRIVLTGDSAAERMLSMYNKEKNFVPMVVYPSGFQLFRKYRDFLMKRNWDYSLTLLEQDATIMFGSGEHTILR